jgi:hypothetical protein
MTRRLFMMTTVTLWKNGNMVFKVLAHMGEHVLLKKYRRYSDESYKFHEYVVAWLPNFKDGVELEKAVVTSFDKGENEETNFVIVGTLDWASGNYLIHQQDALDVFYGKIMKMEPNEKAHLVGSYYAQLILQLLNDGNDRDDLAGMDSEQLHSALRDIYAVMVKEGIHNTYDRYAGVMVSKLWDCIDRADTEEPQVGDVDICNAVRNILTRYEVI